MRIDHSQIPAEHLAIARFNASNAPWAQIFPWEGMQPLVGNTVVHGGKLWTVHDRDVECITLVGQGHDEVRAAFRDNLRPVTWTQRDEDSLHG